MGDIIQTITAYLPAGYIVICLGLIVIAEMLKKYTVLPNQLLTTVLPILGGIILSIDYVSSADVLDVPTLIRHICVGLLLGWSATGGFEWFKNTFLVKSDTVKTIEVAEKEKTSEEQFKEEISKEIIDEQQENE